MRESSECSGKTACILSLVWALTEKYVIFTPILCMCESSEGSGETARMLRLVWTRINMYYIWAISHHFGTYCICINSVCKHTHTLTWSDSLSTFILSMCMLQRLCRDYSHAQARLSIDWKNLPYVHPFCAFVRAVKALARLHTCSCASENWLLECTACAPNFEHVWEQWEL